MSRRLKHWGIVLCIVVLIAVPIIIITLRWMNDSSDGNVSVGKTTNQTEQQSKPITIKTPYFITSLPAGFSIKQQTETPNSNQLQLQLMAYGSSSLPEQFAATVGTMPSDGLRGIGDYNLRITTPTTYSLFSPISNPAGSTAFRTTNGVAAFTVFWPHGTHYVELALSTDGGITLEQLEAVYAQVMASWSWQ